jgi:hypothetical protein
LSLGYSTQRNARFLGTPSNLGNGTVASFAEFDKCGAPKAIGVVFSTGALEALPAAPSDGHRCFDANNTGEKQNRGAITRAGGSRLRNKVISASG